MGTIRRRCALAVTIALPLQLACTPAAAPPSPAKAASPPVARISDEPAAIFVASSSGKARTTDEVLTELRALERMAADTPPGSPDLPRIYRKLAEGYVDLESAALRVQIDRESQATAARSKVPSAEAERLAGLVAAARSNAIKFYGVLAASYPTFCVSPGSQCGDEVLYHLAYEHEQGNQSDDARRVYLALIKGFPQSSFLPHAYLAFAERLFMDAQGDPSKLGLAEFQQVIDFAAKFPSLPNAEKLGVMARKDLVPVYALSGEPGKAFDFFKALSGDPAGETGRALAMSVELGKSYVDTGHYRECVLLDLDLLQRAAGEPSCALLAQLDQAVLRATKEETADLRPPLARGKRLLEKAHARCPRQAGGDPARSIHKCAPGDPCSAL